MRIIGSTSREIFFSLWFCSIVLRDKRATAFTLRLSHRSSVCQSVCPTGGSVKNGAR